MRRWKLVKDLKKVRLGDRQERYFADRETSLLRRHATRSLEETDPEKKHFPAVKTVERYGVRRGALSPDNCVLESGIEPAAADSRVVRGKLCSLPTEKSMPSPQAVAPHLDRGFTDRADSLH